jgi:predicted small secreted protein
MKKLIIIMCLFWSLSLSAQETYQGAEQTKVEMADQFRAQGKIYVVIAVVSTVLAGLLIYAFSIDRRLSKLEKET